MINLIVAFCQERCSTMRIKRLGKKLFDLIRPKQQADRSGFARARGQVTHVIILDGTMSSLTPGEETNAGITYRLLREMGNAVSVYYEAGVQWGDWRNTPDVILGRGINRQIRRAYGYLASRYHPGDRIFLMGYSRGAYAVRSLAGVIDQIGLLRADQATERNITQAYRHYQCNPNGAGSKAFAAAHCHPETPIEMVGVWDTVKALGLRWPLIWRWSPSAHEFHNSSLGQSIHHGYQALALDETRSAFTPVLWHCPQDWTGHMEQVWFRGCHSDIGGQLGGRTKARKLSNIPLVWMLERAEDCNLPLPEAWRWRFATDVDAPSLGSWTGWGKLFLMRSRRVVGTDKSERLHETVQMRGIDMRALQKAL